MASALLLFPFTSFNVDVGVRKPGAVPRRAAVPLCGTCRVCKNSYDPADNGPRACQHHPGTIRGESARKGNWEGARGTDEGQSGDLVYSWTCCGQPRDAPGCTFAPCVSYDDDGSGSRWRPPQMSASATPPAAPRWRPPQMCAPAPPAVAGQVGEVLPQTYFEELQYGDGQNVPWDLLGRPQPPVRNAAREGAFGAAGTAILDCGSGAGDNANWLAARGYAVLGFDLSPSAVATARERAAAADAAADIAAAGGATEFVEASATALGEAARVQARARELGGFAVALDAAMLHCLDDDAQIAYVDGLRPLLRRGGRLFVGAFSDANPDPWSNPRRLSEAQLRALLCEERGWRVAALESCWFERPQNRAVSSGGAWTMAWWCTAEAV